MSLEILKQGNQSSMFAKCQTEGGSTVRSILEKKDKIKQCGKISTPMRASKLNSRVLCVLQTVNLISVMKYTWQWGNYH